MVFFCLYSFFWNSDLCDRLLCVLGQLGYCALPFKHWPRCLGVCKFINLYSQLGLSIMCVGPRIFSSKSTPKKFYSFPDYWLACGLLFQCCKTSS